MNMNIEKRNPVSQNGDVDALIAMFVFAISNDALESIRIWTTSDIDPNATVYIYAATTYENAEAGTWVKLTNSGKTVSQLTFDDEHIADYGDVQFTAAETAENYRFFRPAVSTSGDDILGSKYVGIVDVNMDAYGQTGAGIPFVSFLSGTNHPELSAYSNPDIGIYDLVETESRFGSFIDIAADQLLVYETEERYVFDKNKKWCPMMTNDHTPLAVETYKFKRGTGFAIKRTGVAWPVEGIIRLRGQVENTPVDRSGSVSSGDPLSNEIPTDLDLNNCSSGVFPAPLDSSINISYTTDTDHTSQIYFGEYPIDPDDQTGEKTNGWYYTKVVISKGKRTTKKLKAPIIPAGRLAMYYISPV